MQTVLQLESFSLFIPELRALLWPVFVWVLKLPPSFPVARIGITLVKSRLAEEETDRIRLTACVSSSWFRRWFYTIFKQLNIPPHTHTHTSKLWPALWALLWVRLAFKVFSLALDSAASFLGIFCWTSAGFCTWLVALINWTGSFCLFERGLMLSRRGGTRGGGSSGSRKSLVKTEGLRCRVWLAPPFTMVLLNDGKGKSVEDWQWDERRTSTFV